jgi:hypothetical protein
MNPPISFRLGLLDAVGSGGCDPRSGGSVDASLSQNDTGVFVPDEELELPPPGD